FNDQLPENPLWLPASEVASAQLLVDQFHSTNPHKSHPNHIRQSRRRPRLYDFENSNSL
ncbi:MAG: hypothetical protein M1826_004560, partial [Phylliscum demangeonii]